MIPIFFWCSDYVDQEKESIVHPTNRRKQIGSAFGWRLPEFTDVGVEQPQSRLQSHLESHLTVEAVEDDLSPSIHMYPPTPADARGSAPGNNTFDSCFGLLPQPAQQQQQLLLLLWVSEVTLGIFGVQFWGFSVLQRHGVSLPAGDFFHGVFHPGTTTTTTTTTTTMGFRSYIRHFRGAILGLLRPSEAWCFPAGR